MEMKEIFLINYIEKILYFVFFFSMGIYFR